MTATSTATGGSAEAGFVIPSFGAGGAAAASSTATSTGSGSVSSSVTAVGGAGGDGAKGGDASAASAATSRGSASVSASAGATAGQGGDPGSGAASAKSTAQNASGAVVTTAQSPAALSFNQLGAASAMSAAAVGAGAPVLAPLAAGQTVSNATLTPGSQTIGAGAMSAAYGGTGEPLTYQSVADFNFVTSAPEQLYLNLLDNDAAGVGVDQLELRIDASGTLFDYVFSSLADAETFFYRDPLDLGAIGAGNQVVDISYWLTASEPRAGFGFDYELSPHAIPEPSTWAMMMLGFVGLCFVGYRRSQLGATLSA